MKILHTSDWHLGHSLYNYDRNEEHCAMLKQMTDIVRHNKPDVMLICGDVYHTSQPSAAVQKMLIDALVEIHLAAPDMAIVMTAGNHDSGTKHEVFQTPWKVLNVYVIGQINKENWEEHIVSLPGKGFIIAVPYASERNIPEGFFQRLLDKVNEINIDKLPVIMTAHTTVKGYDFTGHEHADEYTAGGIDAADIEDFGIGYDYLALGHIHKPQFVHSGSHNVRYSGTPIPVSFDEQYSHSVTILDIKRHGDKPEYEVIDIFNPWPIVTLPTEGFASWEEAKQLLRDFPDNQPAYIRLNVEIEGFLPADAQIETAMMADNKACRFCLINAKRKNEKRNKHETLSIQEFQELKPMDIAKRYAEDTGINFDEEMEKMFYDAMKRVEEEKRNQ